MSRTDPREARVQRIRSRLESRFAPLALELVDESDRHAGHPGARSGRGHFRLRIVSAAFESVPRVQRHRLVYDALGPVMDQDIHALSIEALAPSEVASTR